MGQSQLESLADEAQDAFWEVVGRRFPQARSGDLSPGATVQLDRAAEAAIKEWVENNVEPSPAFPQPPYYVGESQAEGVYGGEKHYAILADKERGIVADIDGGLTPEAKAAAEYFVRAANTHDDLVTACDGMIGLLYRDKNDDERIEFDQYEEAERACKKAVAKAKGEAA